MTILALLAAVPLARATYANRRTALVHALAWAWVAWLAWTGTAFDPTPVRRYLAAAMTGCAGVAVLGARRPGVGAWHFVVAGLLVVLLLPAAEGFALGTPVHLDTPRMVFIAVLLGTCAINYLPTRVGGGAACLGFGLATLDTSPWLGLPTALLAPWAAWAGVVVRNKSSTPDALWRDFRDRFGAIWALRVREQFNAAARNAGLAVELGWLGMRGLVPQNAGAARELLAMLVQRFGLQ